MLCPYYKGKINAVKGYTAAHSENHVKQIYFMIKIETSINVESNATYSRQYAVWH
jgi:hypothetical protein